MDIYNEMKALFTRTGFSQSYGDQDHIVIRSPHGHEYLFDDADQAVEFLSDINNTAGSLDITEARRLLELDVNIYTVNSLPVFHSKIPEKRGGILYVCDEYMADIPKSSYALVLKRTSAVAGELVGRSMEYYLQSPIQLRSLITPEELKTDVISYNRTTWEAPAHYARIVQGYRVFRVEPMGLDTEIVAAHNPRAPQQFVTWCATRDEKEPDGWDYRWGHYSNSYDHVLIDLRDRAGNMAYNALFMDKVTCIDISEEMYALEVFKNKSMPLVEVSEIPREDEDKYRKTFEKVLDDFKSELEDYEMVATPLETSFVASEYKRPITGVNNYYVVMHLVESGFRTMDEPEAPYYECEKQKHFLIEFPNGERVPLNSREVKAHMIILADHGHSFDRISAKVKCHEDKESDWER